MLNVQNLPFFVSDPHVKIIVFGDKNLIACRRYSVAERSTIGGIVGLHPETHGKLGHVRHAPNVYHISHILLWELKSIVYGRM